MSSIPAPAYPMQPAEAAPRGRRLAVWGLVAGAIALFALALREPWWFFRLYAPQYPRGLTLIISLTGLDGDTREINMLNHYIGMASLDDAAALERQFAFHGVAALALTLVAVQCFVRPARSWLLPALGALFPLGFIADSFYWLHRFGHDLDPRAPLRIPGFTPQLFGNGTIGQFMTFARPERGFWLAAVGVLLLLAASLVRVRLPALLSLLLVACTTPATPLTAPPAAGPIAQSIPAGANIARDGAHLASLLADPSGPSEIWLRAARYDGDFAINRRLQLRGEPGATLFGSGRDTVLRVQADEAVVDNLIVRHSGGRHTAEDAGIRAQGRAIQIRNVRVEDALFGVSLGPCPRCVLERVHVVGSSDAAQLKGDGIKVWESDDAVVRHCRVDHVRDLVVWYSRRVLLEGNSVRHSRYGSHFMYAHDSIVRDSVIENNVVGIFVMYSARLQLERNVLAGARGAAGVGIGFKESDAVRAQGNWIVANTTGVYLDETPRSQNAPVDFHRNHFALNDVALRFHGVREPLRFLGNTFEHNATLADVEGGGDALVAQFMGNHFSDYAGYDLNTDGVGDVAYQVKRLSGDLVSAEPMLAFFHGTAAMSLLDAVATAAPIFASRLLLEDPQPSFSEIQP